MATTLLIIEGGAIFVAASATLEDGRLVLLPHVPELLRRGALPLPAEETIRDAWAWFQEHDYTHAKEAKTKLKPRSVTSDAGHGG